MANYFTITAINTSSLTYNINGGTSITLNNPFQTTSTNHTTITSNINSNNNLSFDGYDPFTFSAGMFLDVDTYINTQGMTGFNRSISSLSSSGEDTIYSTATPIIGFYNISNSNYYWFAKIVQMCFPNFTNIKTKNGIKKIEEIERNDLVLTQTGYKPVVKNIKTLTPNGYKFVKFSRNCLKEGFPFEDVYITKDHSFSLGKFKNEDLHNGIKQNNLDDYVYLHISAYEFINRIDGITEVKLDIPSYHNLVFDDHQVLNLGGLGAMSHHPNGNPHKINKDEYIQKINDKDCKPIIRDWNQLIEGKKFSENLGEYIFNKIKF